LGEEKKAQLQEGGGEIDINLGWDCNRLIFVRGSPAVFLEKTLFAGKRRAKPRENEN